MEEKLQQDPYDQCISELSQITLNKITRDVHDVAGDSGEPDNAPAVDDAATSGISKQQSMIATDIPPTKQQLIKSQQGVPVLRSRKSQSTTDRRSYLDLIHGESNSAAGSPSASSSVAPSMNRPRGRSLTRPGGQKVYSPRTEREIDTNTSLRRYSLFGPNVSPVWEYYTDVPGLIDIPSDTPIWKVSMFQKRNCSLVHGVMRREEEERCRRELERIELERRTCVPEWMREITNRRRRRKLEILDSPTDNSNQGGDYDEIPSGSNLRSRTLPPWQQELMQRKQGQLTKRVQI